MKLKGVLVGCGYFSQFHIEARQRIPDVELVAIRDSDVEKARTTVAKWGISGQVFSLLEEALATFPETDFVDIATPPATHLKLVEKASARHKAIICQKPLAPTLEEARKLVTLTEASG